MEQQVTDTPWSVFDRVIYKDESTTQYEYVQYQERNVNVSGLNEYNLVTQDLDVPLLMSDAFVQVRLSATGANGAALTAGQIVAINNNGYNIFDRAVYRMNEQNVEDINYLGPTTLVKGLIDYSKAYSDSACNILWELDDQNNDAFGLQCFRNLAGDRLTISTLGGNLNLTRAANQIILVNAQVVTFYYYGQPITWKVKHAVGETVIAATVRIAATDETGTNATIDFGAGVLLQHDEVHAYLPDGSELFFTLNNQLATLCCPDAAEIQVFTNVVAPDASIISAIAGSTSIENSFQKERIKLLLNKTTNISSNNLNLFLPLRYMFSIFQANQHIWRGIKHTIVLYKNQNYKTVFMVDGNNGNNETSLLIDQISLWVPALRPSIEYGLKLDKELNSGMETKIMWNKLQTFRNEFNATDGNGGYISWRITGAGTKPVRVYIIFRTSNKYNSTDLTQGNAMLLDHMGITNIQLRINSLQFPREEFVCDFVNPATYDWQRVYLQYLMMTNKTFDVEGGGFAVCYDDFQDKFPIFCFDLTHQDPQIWANVTSADIELRFIRNAAANNGNFEALAIVEMEKKISLIGSNNRLSVIL